jgi:hypothetical protein
VAPPLPVFPLLAAPLPLPLPSEPIGVVAEFCCDIGCEAVGDCISVPGVVGVIVPGGVAFWEVAGVSLPPLLPALAAIARPVPPSRNVVVTAMRNIFVAIDLLLFWWSVESQRATWVAVPRAYYTEARLSVDDM